MANMWILNDDPEGERLRNWCIWKVTLPLGLMYLLYLACWHIVLLKHPFAEAFAHGDLLLFSGLILMESAVEGEHIRKKGGLFHVFMSLAKVLAVLFLVGFAGTKIDVMWHQSRAIPGSESPDLLAKMATYSLVNWVTAIFAVFYSIAAFSMTVNKEREERLARIASGTGQSEAKP